MRRFVLSIFAAVSLTAALTFMMTAGAAVKDNFMADAAQANMAEIALSNMALQRAQSDAVKQFAQQMVTDHTAAGQELAALAQSKNVTLPAEMDPKHKALSEKLGARTGADFDRDYMKAMVDDHQKAVKLFQNEANKGDDADAKAWAAKTLPTLQGHLSMAQSTYAMVGGKGGKAGMNSSANMHSDMNTNSGGNMNSEMNMNSGSNSNRGTNSNSNRRTNSNGNSNSNRRGNTNTNGNTNSNRL